MLRLATATFAARGVRWSPQQAIAGKLLRPCARSLCHGRGKPLPSVLDPSPLEAREADGEIPLSSPVDHAAIAMSFDETVRTFLASAIAEEVLARTTGAPSSEARVFPGFRLWLERNAPNGFRSAVEATREEEGLEAAHQLLVEPYVEWLQLDDTGDDKAQRAELLRWCTDMTHPHEWFPAARELRRSIVLHVGPTNSGKTHAAMEALKKAPDGLYCGPLRLLAWEVHERLTEDGVPCDLVTGQEHVQLQGARHAAVTVEMASTSRVYSCAVLDEIQMLGHDQRGWAWTRALLGLQARELHLCGDGTAVDLLEKLCRLTGDQLTVKRYKRLSELRMENKPVQSIKHLEAGDTVVAFSRRRLFALKATIERERKLRCAIIYGNLPPEARKAQAQRFNEVHPDSPQVLVASDAVGMGLNLNIGRIVFETTHKFDGKQTRSLLPTEVKQIAGRAGRYRSNFPVGRVTCLGGDDLNYVRAAMAQDLEPLGQCGLRPTASQLEAFAQTTTPRRFSSVLRAFFDAVRTDSGLYFVCEANELYRAARLIDWIPLTITERYEFCTVPIDVKDVFQAKWLYRFAKAYARYGETGRPWKIDLKLPPGNAGTPGAVFLLEQCHAVLDAYLWLCRRFPDAFGRQEHARVLREEACEKIDAALQNRMKGEKPGDSRRQRRSSGKRGDDRRATPADEVRADTNTTRAKAMHRHHRRVANQVLRCFGPASGLRAPAS